MKKYHYTYYSYEEFGRGYIGKRSCNCKPEEDVKYFGSYKDQTFHPTQKIILETYRTEKEAAKKEKILHAFYDVKNNPHFANKHNANEKFCTTEYLKKTTPEQRSETARKRQASRTPEQRSEAIRKGRAKMSPEQRSESAKKAAASRTPEERSETARKAAARLTPEQRSEIARKQQESRTPEQRSEIARKASMSASLKLTPEQRSENARKWQASRTPEERSESARKTSRQRWQCTVTHHISNPGNLSNYQKARGIDTSNRVRIG